jgi:hypothetical protein
LALFTVHDVHHLDFNYPESNGFGFLAFKVPDIKSDAGRFLYEKFRLMFSNIIVDLADIARLSGTVVLGGQAFHFVVPTFPDFMKEQYEDLFDLEQTHCSNTEKSSTSST